MAFLDDDAASGGLSADQIVQKMKGDAANGTPTLDAASAAATQVQGIHAEIEGHIGGALSKLMDAWKGDAAQYAQENITPMQSVLQKSQDDLAHAQNISSRQSGSFHDATHALVDVPPKPSNNFLNVVNPFHTSLDDKINEWNRAQSTNIAVYNSYTSASNYNHDNMPTTYGDVSNNSTPTNPRVPVTPKDRATVPAWVASRERAVLVPQPPLAVRVWLAPPAPVEWVRALVVAAARRKKTASTRRRRTWRATTPTRSWAIYRPRRRRSSA